MAEDHGKMAILRLLLQSLKLLQYDIHRPNCPLEAVCVCVCVHARMHVHECMHMSRTIKSVKVTAIQEYITIIPLHSWTRAVI